MKNYEDRVNKLLEDVRNNGEISLLVIGLGHESGSIRVGLSINDPNEDYCEDFQVFAILSAAILTYGNDANQYCCAKCFFKELASFMDELVFEDENSDESKLDEG